jgi:glycosyltransferase involved in cell wall biosynthesis
MTHHAGPLIYGGIAARMAGVKTHLHVEHDVWHLSSPRRRRLVSGFGRLLRPTVVGVSEKMRDALASTYKTCDIHIVPNGVDLPETSVSRDEARRALGLPPRAMVVGAAGRLEAVKGHDVLIAAMTRLPDDVLLVSAGEGSLRARLEDDAARLRVADRVRFLGHRDDLNAIYPAFDVFCQPSRNEGLPLTILEAQAMGVPVVASAVGDVPLGVCPLSGELAPPDDPDTLSAALARTLRKPRPSPREFITRHFDFRATAEGYSRLIEG